jgi:hypothetical protein
MKKSFWKVKRTCCPWTMRLKENASNPNNKINKLLELNLDVKGIFQRHIEEMEEDEDN